MGDNCKCGGLEERVAQLEREVAELKGQAPERPEEKVDMKTVATADLIRELENRAGIEKVFVGPYQPYRLKAKFSNNRAELTPDFVLVVNRQDYLEGCHSNTSLP